MRDALMVELEKLASRDSKVLLLTGDHGATLFGNFQTLFPKQYINMGIAEQNMVGVSAGLARAGFRPFVYGLSAFIPIRVLEQIKLDVCHDKLPVVFLGDGAGLVYSQLGTSHQTTEDIAVTRVIPELAVFSPADKLEMIASINLAFDIKAPVYLRIGKSDVGNVHKKELTFNKVNSSHFPSVKLIDKCLNFGALTPTIINASNEVLVSLFLQKKLKFLDIVKKINKILKDKDFKKYAKRQPRTAKDILKADNWARLKTLSMCVK